MVAEGGYDKAEIKKEYPELVEATGVAEPPVIEEKDNSYISNYLNFF